eukprot:11922943-Heterocapsa_arctica.AAC.4
MPMLQSQVRIHPVADGVRRHEDSTEHEAVELELEEVEARRVVPHSASDLVHEGGLGGLVRPAQTLAAGLREGRAPVPWCEDVALAQLGRVV